MSLERHYAHSLRDQPIERWHELRQHLTDTAEMAESFASFWGAGWCRIAGMWHDAGKYQRAFQQRIGSEPDAHTNQAVDHSSVGALIASNRGGAPLSFVIAGHHGGLPNYQDLRSRLANKQDLLEIARRDGLPSDLEGLPLPRPPSFIGTDKRKLALWTRFLFSALVDADFLDTERFYEGGRTSSYPEIPELLEQLEREIGKLNGRAAPTAVNRMRARVVDACREAAVLPQGAFTMTVPTGGGKTLSSLLFALRHAAIHGLRRVIVVLPFTSIIEQTAAIYRGIFGDKAVVEHHSNLDPDHETPANRLASENWDAPLVVTTSVQFFESLFANRTSRCRKLHRIPGSVVIFDEVQTFPVELMTPIRDVLTQLTNDYRTTLVLCTATQPALDLPNTREIISDYREHFRLVAGRCSYSFPTEEAVVSWEELAQRTKEQSRVLVIVNKRKDAEELARLMGEDCFHLLARMCPAHRTAVLAEIKRRLRGGEDCQVVATQLVEAGVDLDFPVVFRAFAGADSLAQAAGRCNREGGGTPGEMHVFLPPSEPPRGVLRTAKQRAYSMWRAGALDLREPSTFTEYFRRLYGSINSDPGVLAGERELRFEDVATLFRMIDSNGETVIAPYGDSPARIDEIRKAGLNRRALRRLQSYSVQLYSQEVKQLASQGALEQVEEKLWSVAHGYKSVYSERFGFAWQGGRIFAEPESFIA